MEKKVHVLPVAPRDTIPPDTGEPVDIVRVARFLRRLSEAHYFGKVTLSFQSGKITDLRAEQVMKIDDL